MNSDRILICLKYDRRGRSRGLSFSLQSQPGGAPRVERVGDGRLRGARGVRDPWGSGPVG